MVMMSTVTGALLVEIGQSRGATGRLTAVRQFTQNACQLVTGPLGGLLASGAFMFVAGVNALFVVSIFPVAYYLLREPRSIAAPAVDSFAAAGRQLRSMAASWPFWFAIVFIGLFYFAPGIGTVSFFREQNVMHLSTRQQGLLVSIYGLGGIVAAVVYGLAVRRVRIRPLLLVGIVAASVATVGFLWYNDLPSALALQLVNGLCFGFAEVALIDLAARATPAGCEGLGYSCILSMRNLSLFGADKIGAHLSDAFHLGWGTMVWLNAATTAVVLVLLPLMPRKLMGSRDQPVAS
jgi:Na+/melibiose symporter-like transporter